MVLVRSVIRRVIPLAALALSAGLAKEANADRVVLRDGQVLEGIVTERGGTVEVRMDLGTVGFARKEVKSIEKTSSPLSEFQKRKENVSRTDAAKLRELAEWAERNGLDAQAIGIYRQLLEVAPDDASARAKLGFNKVDGKWVTEDEEMSAKGMVKYLGRWVTKDEALRLEAEDSARYSKRLEADRDRDRIHGERVRAAQLAQSEAESDGGYLRSDVRMDGGYPEYAAYDSATSSLYVIPWMRSAIFFPPQLPQGSFNHGHGHPDKPGVEIAKPGPKPTWQQGQVPREVQRAQIPQPAPRSGLRH